MKFVVINSDGQITRHIHSRSENFYVVYRRDNKRVEATSDLKELDDLEIKYDLLHHVIHPSPHSVETYPLPSGATLRLVNGTDKIRFDVRPEVPTSEIRNSLLYSSVIGVAILLLTLLVSVLIKTDPSSQSPELITVKIIPDSRVVKKVTVKPNTVVTSRAPVRKIIKPRARQSTKITVAKSRSSVSKFQGVLGALSSHLGPSGLKVDTRQSTRGPGLGGLRGSGGSQSEFYSKGLTGAALGVGHVINGRGGIGTRGQGGGQAGYGRRSLTGGQSILHGVEADTFIEGGLDRDEIASVIQRHLGQIRYCYEEGLQTKPQLSGRVAIRFIISDTGFVSLANVSHTSLKSQNVESCIVSRLKTWRFPEPRGGVNVKVTYPFVLKRLSQG